MHPLLSLALLSSLVLGAPGSHPVTRADPVIEIRDFYAGGMYPTTRNFVIFSVRPTPGASFANCSINTDTGPVVPTVKRATCTDLNSVIWSLEPMGTGMHFTVEWAFTSHASIKGGRHFEAGDFKNTTIFDGSQMQSYDGPHSFTVPAKTVIPGLDQEGR